MTVWWLDECEWHEPRAKRLTPVPLPRWAAYYLAGLWLRLNPGVIIWSSP